MKQVCAKMRNTWSGLEEVTWPKSGRVRLVVMISMPDFVAGWDNLLFIAANDIRNHSLGVIMDIARSISNMKSTRLNISQFRIPLTFLNCT